MKNTKLFFIIAILISIVLLIGCSTEKASSQNKKEITMGEVEENTYTNDYFGLTFDIPSGWTILSDEEKELIQQAGQARVAENNEELAERMELSQARTLNLLYAFQHPLDYEEGTNASIICMAENLGFMGEIAVKDGEDYLNFTKQGLEQAGMPYTFEEITTETLGNKEFHVMTAKIEIDDINIIQKYYAAIFDKYALTFVTTTYNDEDKAQIQSALDSIAFTE